MPELGKILIGLGAGLIVIGLVFTFIGKPIGFWKLPGDILIKKENFTFYFPLTSCLFLSLLLSLIFLWLRR